MIVVTQKLHRILAPRVVVLIGTTSADGRKNIIPINNITSVSTDPGMAIIAVYKPWVTALNLRSAKGFTVSVPTKDQLGLVWKLGQKYSGYSSGKDKMTEFAAHLDTEFSAYGPVLKDALGWLECKIIDLPKDVGGNHLMVIGQFTKAMVDPASFTNEIVPIGNPRPFMQWEGNKFSAASDIFDIDYFGSKKG